MDDEGLSKSIERLTRFSAGLGLHTRSAHEQAKELEEILAELKERSAKVVRKLYRQELQRY